MNGEKAMEACGGKTEKTPLLFACDRCLRVVVSILLISRGWLSLRWDSPIRGLVWQEEWWTGPLQRFAGMSWPEFAENSEPHLTSGLEVIGVVLIVLGFVPWLALLPAFRWVRWLLIPASVILLLDAAGQWVNADIEFGMGIEHTLQWVAPLALLGITKKRAARFVPTILLTAAALTFVGHGLYAVGFHDVPLVYQTMTMKILGCSLDRAHEFLFVAGILDFIGAFFVFWKRTRMPALAYMVLWGAATALARWWAHGTPDPWIAETLVRTPHWVIPMILLLHFRAMTRSSNPVLRHQSEEEDAAIAHCQPR